MRVEIVITCVLADSWRVLRAGEVHDLPDDDARSLIAGGLARRLEGEMATIAPPEAAIAQDRPRRRR